MTTRGTGVGRSPPSSAHLPLRSAFTFSEDGAGSGMHWRCTMTDLRERFRAVDEVPFPELLAEARRRAERPGQPPSWPEGPRGGRLVAGLVASALFVGGSVLAARV